MTFQDAALNAIPLAILLGVLGGVCFNRIKPVGRISTQGRITLIFLPIPLTSAITNVWNKPVVLALLALVFMVAMMAGLITHTIIRLIR